MNKATIFTAKYTMYENQRKNLTFMLLFEFHALVNITQNISQSILQHSAEFTGAFIIEVL